ncbi:MAG: DNA gyrase subunit A [Holosporales bacterium]|jgi:DNA gyrase subunit A|nr:DNA gyrase subunit A [Holosporales bacterium]
MSEEPNNGVVARVSLEEEMQSSYLDYAMSVIVARALPDVCDGLKPVHRRILYGMKEGGHDYNKPYRKSAHIVGKVMGTLHPHGDAPIYGALVRMAQSFSMGLPLIDGQGNFGSIDGDSPAAMRYTEARLTKSAHALLDELDFDTVDFGENYDGSVLEPKLLPARFPNLLVNGGSGIAVGMATNIPTHNLGEVVAACRALLQDPGLALEELLRIVPGPDFPTGGIILGRRGIEEAYATGRGSVVVRAKTTIEEIRKDRWAIVVTEIPYQVNKARLVEKIAELVQNKTIEGISDLRDESDREGIRVVIELKRDAAPEVILNQLLRHTTLQVNFSVNMLALDHGRPRLLALKDVLEAFLLFRREVVVRRTRFELKKARDRGHILVGLIMAINNIDEVIALIRGSADAQAAKQALLERTWPAGETAPLAALIDDPDSVVLEGRCRLTETQAQAILDLKLQRLTGLERTKVVQEIEELAKRIQDLLDILHSPERVTQIIDTDLARLQSEFPTPRRTEITGTAQTIDDEDLIQHENMVITVSHQGYIKRVPAASYRVQRRGGKGRSGMATKEEDFVHDIFFADTHTPILFFSTTGKVYQTKVHRLPIGTPQSRGKAVINLLPVAQGETISTILPLLGEAAEQETQNIVFATSHGTIRRNRLSDFLNIRSNGKIAMKLEEGERLIAVAICQDGDDILLAARFGKCVRFPISVLRVFSGHTSTGVLGMRLAQGDEVISMAILHPGDATPEEREAYVRYASWQRRTPEEDLFTDRPEIALAPERLERMAVSEQMILTVTERGYGKRTSSHEYRTTQRGVQGVKNIKVGGKNGDAVAVFPVEETDEIMLITDKGQLIRCAVSEIRIISRATQGTILFRIDVDEKVVSATRIFEEEE